MRCLIYNLIACKKVVRKNVILMRTTRKINLNFTGNGQHNGKKAIHKVWVPAGLHDYFILSKAKQNCQSLELPAFRAQVDTSNEQRYPEVILTYNETKAGVYTMDQMTRTYTCKRKTRRWPLVVFYNLLGISAINASVIWKALNPNWNSNKSHKKRLSPPIRKGSSRSK